MLLRPEMVVVEVVSNRFSKVAKSYTSVAQILN